MKLYKIFQTVNDRYDTYDSAVVCAENEDAARKIHPYTNEPVKDESELSDWCSLKDVQIQYIGEADALTKKGVIVASFNAG